MINKMWDYIRGKLIKNQDSFIEESLGKVYTYRQLLEEIEYLSKEARNRGLGGKKCIVLCDKTIEAVKGLFFCWSVNMIVIPLSLQYGQNQCNDVIGFLNPDLIITDNSRICTTYENAYYMNNIQKWCISEEKEVDETENIDGIEVMLCTSGTTGIPKLSMFSANELIWNLEAIVDYYTVNQNDTMLICRPIYHCAVLVGELLVAITVGADVLLYSNGYNPMVLSSLLCERNITVLAGTPTILKGIADCLKHRKKKSNLKTIAVSGECLIKNYAIDIRNAFPQARIFNVYGLTEAGPRVTYLPFELFDKIPQSVGKPLKGIELCIRNEEEKEISQGEIGIIWIHTPSIMKGYYNDLYKTRSKYKNNWFNTGDLGFVDGDGHLYVVGRYDDMIIKSGVNIYPQEIEKRISILPEVKNVMVYGLIEKEIESIKAEVIVNEKFENITEFEITKKISKVLPNYIMPKYICIVDDFPRNASGKIVRPRKKMRKINVRADN